MAGKAIAERYDPTVEDAYWRDQHTKESYYNRDYSYDDYSPAYRLGGESRSKYSGRDYGSVESDLGHDWDKVKGKSRMTWEEAKSATRAGWNRIAN